MESPLRFKFNFAKFVAAMVYLAQRVPDFTKLHASKLLFFADKYHLVKYGRPVIGDRYIKMEWGPVPSSALNWMNEVILPMRLKNIQQPHLDQLEEYLSVKHGGRHPIFKAKREPDFSVLSESDIDALDHAIARYGKKTVTEVCNAGHGERAWKETPDLGVMDYRLFFDDSDPEQRATLEFAEEQAENDDLLEQLSCD